MKRVTIAAGLAVLVAASATLATQSWHERESALAVARAERDQLTRQLGEARQMLANALSCSDGADVPTEKIAAPAARPAVSEDSSAERDARAEAMRQGNELVDRAIANGLATPADFNAIQSATIVLSTAERTQIVARLAAAINSEQVRLAPQKLP